MFQKSFYNFLFSLFIVVLTAFLCSYFNRIGMQSFYDAIKLPAITPPNYVFPIAWLILYTLLTFAYAKILDNRQNRHLIFHSILFLLNMLLQIIWTYAFFAKGMFLWGLVIIVLLDIETLVLMLLSHKQNRSTTLLLIPYILWLLYATAINFGVYTLNGSQYVF